MLCFAFCRFAVDVVTVVVDVRFLNPLFPFSCIRYFYLIIVYIPSPIIDVEELIRLIKNTFQEEILESIYFFLLWLAPMYQGRCIYTDGTRRTLEWNISKTLCRGKHSLTQKENIFRTT